MSDFWRSLIALAIVLPSIVVVVYLLKRFMVLPLKQNQQLRLVSQLPIDGKHQLAIVETDDIQLIIGLSPSQMTVLHQSQPNQTTNRKGMTKP